MNTHTGLAASLLLTLACGDDGEARGTEASSSTSTADSEGGMQTTMASGDTTTAMASTGQTTAASGDTTATTASEDVTGTMGDSTMGDGMPSLDATMIGLAIFQFCGPPDPTGASFTLELTNTGDVPASATVLAAAFTLGEAPLATIEVTPAEFGPVAVGESIMIDVTKVPNSMMPTNGCLLLNCGQRHILELALDVEGTQVLVSDSAVVDCYF